jgi:hypothetical protein
MHSEPRPSLANVLVVAAMGSFFAAAYALLGEPAPPVVGLFTKFGPIVAVALWFRRYLIWSRRRMPFDYGYFLLIGWPILIPIDALRMHGRRGWLLVGQLYALAIAPAVVAAIIEELAR